MGSFVSTTFTYVAILFVLQLMIGTTFSFPELQTKRAIISAFFSSTLLVSLIYFFGIFFAFFNAIGTLFALITLFTLATLLQASLYAWVFRAPKKHIAIYAIASSILIIIPLMIFS